VYGGFSINVVGVGSFPECRLILRRDGRFFSTGEWLLSANEKDYLRFVEFLEPFSSWLARAVRIELLSHDDNNFGEILPDNEILELNDDERADRAEPQRLDWESALRIEPADRKKRLVTRKMRFDAVIGGAIRIKDCRLVGERGAAHLRLPTSEGLRLRPIQLERNLQYEIVRRAEQYGLEPEPFAA
jgi:hypothetical protein